MNLRIWSYLKFHKNETLWDYVVNIQRAGLLIITIAAFISGFFAPHQFVIAFLSGFLFWGMGRK